MVKIVEFIEIVLKVVVISGVLIEGVNVVLV